MTDSDPLRHAAVGETKTVTSESEYSFWGTTAADPFLGSDRGHDDIHITDAEIVGENGYENIRLEFEGEVTKHLPPRWDQEPREKSHSKTVRSLWQRLVSQVIGAIVGILAVVLSFPVIQTGLSEITINGEPMDAGIIGIVPVIAVILFVFGISTFVEYRNYKREVGSNG